MTQLGPASVSPSAAATASGFRPTTGSVSGWAAGPPTESVAELLRTLELTINGRLDGVLHGNHQGLTPGHGSEPGESRLYQPGDDVRRIDWNITARTGETHVREQIADLSLFYHLQPGDLIFTGTPEGVGPVVAGDRLEGRVEGVGEIVLNIGPAEQDRSRSDPKPSQRRTGETDAP